MSATGNPPSAIRFACPQCGQTLEAPAEAAGQEATCPICKHDSCVPGTPAPPPPAVLLAPSAPRREGPVCAICQSPIDPQEPRTTCPDCGAEYHSDCWTENKGCAVYGCNHVPQTEGRAAIEIPVGYWGQEYKPCPVCNARILAAAVRCRSCGSVFQTARPLDTAEFSRAASHEAQAPRLRRRIVWISVLCIVPFTAPIAAIVGLIWFQSHRENVRNLPALYGALLKIGVSAGFVQTAAIVLLSLLFTVFRS